MKLLLDEDVPAQFMGPLQHLLPAHDVQHVDDLQWKSKKDKHLLPDASRRGFQAILTNDKAQLDDPDLCAVIKKSGLHHIRYRQGHGLRGLALALGAVVAAIPQVMTELDRAEDQQLVEITSLDPSRNRFNAVDPKLDPPRYWGRRQPKRKPPVQRTAGRRD